MKNKDSAYEDRINLAIHRQQQKHVLPKKESLDILHKECPYCQEYGECSRTWDFSSNGHMRQICKNRSTKLDQTWLELYGKDRPQVSIGDKFGKLLVEAAQGHDDHKNPLWQCRCSCGKIKVVRGSNLLNGHTTSCGCGKGKRNDLTSSGASTVYIEEERERRKFLRECLLLDAHRIPDYLISKETITPNGVMIEHRELTYGEVNLMCQRCTVKGKVKEICESIRDCFVGDA